MAEKKYHHQDTDSLYALRTADEKSWEEFGELAQEVFKDYMKYTDGTSGIEAKSFQDSGRGCVRCGDQLVYYEEGENGNVLLDCISCHMKQWSADIMPYSQDELKEMDKQAKAMGLDKARNIPDELFRTIPDDVMNEYLTMRIKSKQGY